MLNRSRQAYSQAFTGESVTLGPQNLNHAQLRNSYFLQGS